jgi:hypothetical protein
MGLDFDFVHVCGINWKHNGSLPVARLIDPGLIIGFDGPVLNGDLHPMSVRLLVSFLEDNPFRYCFCTPLGRDNEQLVVTGGHIEPCNPGEQFEPETDPLKLVNAVRIRLAAEVFRVLRPGSAVHVVVQGDFIRGRHHKTGELRAVDGNHMPPWLPQRLLPDGVRAGQPGSGDGIEGGVFESWFLIEPFDPGDPSNPFGPHVGNGVIFGP